MYQRSSGFPSIQGCPAANSKSEKERSIFRYRSPHLAGQYKLVVASLLWARVSLGCQSFIEQLKGVELERLVSKNGA